MMVTLREAQCRLIKSLEEAGIVSSEAQREADLIIEHATGWRKARQMAEPEALLTPQSLAVIADIEKGRRRRMPLQYLLGEQYFMGLRFKVREGVLIPRADTETLVELALEFLAPLSAPVFADIGTGSGCIAISILHALPAARAYAVDVSPVALAVAAENAQSLGVSSRLTLIECHWADFHAGQLLDAIVCNPPYIPLSQASALLPEVGVFEPKQALFDADEDGLGFFRRLSVGAQAHLRVGGLLAVETGCDQGESVSALFRTTGWKEVGTTLDLNGIIRCVAASHAPM
jgi:release factor glutamine methyltransferase